MPYFRTETAELYYEEIGEGRPIVLLHGFTIDHRLMKGCMEPVFAARPGWKRLYLDLPGMGRTRSYEGITDSDGMLDAVLAAIRQWLPGGEPFCLAGESYGGYLARGIAERSPESVAGLGLICPMILPAHDDRQLPEHRILREDVSLAESAAGPDFDDFRQMAVVANARTWRRYIEDVLPGLRLGDTRFLDGIRERYGFSFPLETAVMDKPGLLVAGRQDASVGYRDALELLERYPRLTYAVLDTAGHNLQFEQPELFEALVHEWLDRVEREQFGPAAAD
ncbi:alpha/beta fold hydrolase [Paenibacillus glufosinatiresistens]|uniref:alpha/beta fold hydrolase n=1 Tax=Paenibacillus glufosinatiresistens TaxID=3070657 RepID=UPI00286D8972|nr:alpha/beta hydrolase [Paenibacillus sp. YX.27]